MENSNRRGFQERHVTYLTVGGTVGAGLLFGVGRGISLAGAGMLIDFLAAAAMVFVVSRCLGAMALADPFCRTFVQSTRRNLGRRPAFVNGWSYFGCAVLACMAELTAAGSIIAGWLPRSPSWASALAALIALFALNRLSARKVGEAEFWLTLVKVLALGLFVLLGLALLVNPAIVPGAAVSNLWQPAGLVPGGIRGVAAAMPIAVFAFGGIELVGIAAADTENPHQTLPRAINGTLWRLVLLYVGVTATILIAIPWRSVPVSGSPLPLILLRTGVPRLAASFEIFLLLAILSSCNSCLYGAIRVLSALAEAECAPSVLAQRRGNGTPGPASLVCAVLVAVTVVLSYAIPGSLFGLLLAASAATGVLNWGIFVVAYLRSGAAGPEHSGQLYVSKLSCYAVLAMILTVMVAMSLDASGAPAMLLVAGSVVLLVVLSRSAASSSSKSGEGGGPTRESF